MSIINEALKKASKDPVEIQNWPRVVLTPLEVKPNKELVKSIPVRHGRRSTIVLKKAGFVCLGVLAAFGISYYGVRFSSKDRAPTLHGSSDSPLAPVSTQSEVAPAAVEVQKFDQLYPASATAQEPEPVIMAPTSQAAEISQKKLSPSKKIPKIRLTGIMMGDPPQALVNGHFVKPGDHLGGVEVVKIYPDHVTFQFEGRKFKKWIY